MKTNLTRLDPVDFIGPEPVLLDPSESDAAAIAAGDGGVVVDAGAAVDTDQPTNNAGAAPSSRIRYVGPKVRLEVSIDEEAFATEIDAAFRKISQQVKTPGFRPGRAPRKVLEAQFGAQIGRARALEDSIPRMYAQALRDNDVEPVGQPDIEVTAGLESGAVAFEAIVEVRPMVQVVGYDQLRIELPSPFPPADEIDTKIDETRQQSADLAEVTRPAQAGDRLTIDIDGSVDGEPLPGLSAQEYLYELGSGGIVPAVDENLLGASAGDTFEFSAPHPVHEDASIDFEIELHKVSEAVLAELTDEWVDENTEHATVEAMRTAVADQLGFNRKLQANMGMRSEAERLLAELVPGPVPDTMIAATVTSRIQELATQLQQRQMDFEQWLQTTGQSSDEFMERLRDEATTGVKLNLALTSIAATEGLEPSTEELTAEMERLAQANDTDVETLMSTTGGGPSTTAIRSWLANNKALEHALDAAELLDEHGSPIDRSDLELQRSAGEAVEGTAGEIAEQNEQDLIE